MIELDIVIPVFNERENIIPVIESFVQHIRTPFRVLICYDFDEDNTLTAIANYPKRQSLNIMNVKNQGQGPHAAVMSGFAASTAPAVLVWPADDDYNAPAIDRLVSEQHRGFDIVVGSRFVRGGSMKGCPFIKAFLVRAASFTLYHLAGLPTHDASNGLRLFSRRVLNSISIESNQGFTYSIELLVKAHRLGYPISEIPVQWSRRKSGESRFKVFKWMVPYLRWYFYAFGTYFHRRENPSRRQV